MCLGFTLIDEVLVFWSLVAGLTPLPILPGIFLSFRVLASQARCWWLLLIRRRLSTCFAGCLVHFVIDARRGLADCLSTLLLASVAGRALAKPVLLWRRTRLVLLLIIVLLVSSRLEGGLVCCL